MKELDKEEVPGSYRAGLTRAKGISHSDDHR